MGSPRVETDAQSASLAASGAANGERSLFRAVAEAVSGLKRAPSVVFAFPSGSKPDGEELRAACTEAGAPVVGMSGNGAIAGSGAIENGCSALALSDEISVGVGIGIEAGEELRAATRSAAHRALEDVESSNKLLLLFLDTRTGDQAEAVAGAYEAAGPTVPLAGGAAGGAEPAQLAGRAVMSHAVVAVALGSENPIGLSQVHGCEVIGTPAIVTRSEDRVIHELNGRPAVDVFLEETGFARAELTDTDFEAHAVTHPLAQPELNRSERIRHVLGRRGTSLVCATRIPENAAVLFTRETPEEVVATAGQGVSEALADLAEAPARAALLFDCAGRKRAAGNSLSHEVAGLLNAFPGARPPLAGLFTHGEIARLRGAKGDRNHALVVAVLA